ncbi:MAG: InlB B-repeat-containing protein [Methanocorpusculum sp.]|nr:InlB B-repeat-containing protein [Methanocorpusculum sp.]
MKKHILLAVAVVLLCVLAVGIVSAENGNADTTPKTYFVNGTSGDDTNNDGSTAEKAFKTIQKAVDTARDVEINGDTILVAAGTYDVTCQNTDETGRPGVQTGSGDASYTNLYITKAVTIKAQDPTKKPTLNAQYKSKMGYAQQTVYIAASNVVLDGFKINPIKNYPNKVVEVIALDSIHSTVTNVTIQNCEIEGYLTGNDKTAVPIYIGSSGVGSYTIQNNILNGTVCIVNGAGNAITSDETAKIIKNQITNGALYLTGMRNSGWDPNSLEKLPVIEDNTLGTEIATINGVATPFVIRSCDTNDNKLLSADQMKNILSKNTLTGYTGGKVVDASEKSYDATLRYLVPDGVIVTDFSELKEQLKNGGTVTLGTAIEGTYTDDSDRVYIDKVASTLDLNGKTLTVTRSSGDGNKGFIKINGTSSSPGSLTVTDSTGNGKIALSKGESEGATLFFVSNYGKIIIDNKDITLTAPQSVIGGNGDGTHTPPTIDIKGGTLTSTEGAAIFLSAENTHMTMTGGSVTGKSGLEIVSGTYTISGGTITGSGNHLEEVAAPDQGSLEDGSGIVLRTTTSYDGNIALAISGTAKIASEKGVAIRNYVRDTDLIGSKTFSVEIKDSAKIEGKVAGIANQKYTGESLAFTASTFTLSGGNYLAPSYDTLLVGEPNVLYADNYAMSDTPVKDGYYAPIVVQKQDSPASCDSETKVVTVSDGTAVASTTNPKEVTVTPAGSDKITLTLTYENAPTVSDDGKTVTPQNPADLSNVKAVYNEITVPETSGVVQAKLTLAVTSGTELLDSDNLPTISTEINEDAKTKLQGTATLISMVTVDITKIKSKNPTLTLTFKVPKSWFTGKDLSAVRAYHFDGTNLVDKGAPQRTKDGTDYVFTITASEASPWLLGLRAATPTPTYQPISSSGDGNMDGALRVLFETSGGSFISPATGLSYGDKITAPANPVKDGYTFAGWYKDSACTQGWSFSDGINGDMTLYAKWTGGSSSSQSSSSQQSGTTTQPTAKATPASTQAQSGTTATTAAPVSTTAAGVTPTLTQAPAPVAGLLFGLLIAGAFLRRRE